MNLPNVDEADEMAMDVIEKEATLETWLAESVQI